MNNPRYAGWTRGGFAFVRRTGANEPTTTNSIFAVTIDATNAPASSGVPDWAWLEDIVFETSNEAGGITTLTFFLSRDAAGDRPITPEATVTLTNGATTATRGGTAAKIQKIHYNQRIATIDVAETIYCTVRTNAGTCSVDVMLFWMA